MIVSFFVNVSMAQKCSQIKYVLPDNVEVVLDSCVKSVGKEKQNFYFVLRKDTSYNITIGMFNKSEGKNILKWIRQSNRYVVINDKTYPLIFDYDFEFGAIESNNIGDFPSREGNIKRVSLIVHGLTVYFSPNGNILRMN